MNNELTESEKKQWESFRRLIDDENPIVRKALITEIFRRGFFIELTDTLARGFVSIRTLPRELGYRLSSNGSALVGRNPKNKLRIGQKIHVQIDRIHTLDKQMDFRMV